MKSQNPVPFGLMSYLAVFLSVSVVGAVAALEAFSQLRSPLERDYLSVFFPPDFSDLPYIASASLDTLSIAITGTTLGFGLALIWVATTFRVSKHWQAIFSSPIWVARGLPDVVFAVVAAQIIGIGPVTGILALAVGTFGVGGKLIADAFSTRNKTLEETLELGGASRPLVTLRAIVPSLFRELLGQFIFRLEVNFRIAIVLGLLGGGGLGLLLDNRLSVLDYRSAVTIVIAIGLFLLAGEQLARLARSRLKDIQLGELRFISPQYVPLLFISWGVAYTTFQVARGGGRFSASQLSLVSSELFAPDFISQSSVLLEGLVTSASLAGFSTLLAFPLAVVIAVISSNTVLRLPKTTIALRRTFAILRSLPIAVVALILIIPFGLGFFTAVLAMVIGGSLFLGRLIGDQLDVSRTELLDNLWMSGASRTRLVLVSLRQIREKLKRNWFFAVDYLFRYSVILGLLGAGGLGTALLNAIRVGDLQTVSAATIVIVLIVGALEFIQQRFQRSGSTNSSKKAVVRRNS